jgi:hypothetical protein
MSSTWRKYDYKSAFVTWPYYHIFKDTPYFESDYVASHNHIYDSNMASPIRKLKLRDGTIIEGFGNDLSFLFIFIIVVILFMCYIYK